MITKKDRILITGANGALGEAVCELFSSIATVVSTDIAMTGFSGTKLDISSAADVRDACAALRPTIIVNLAAITDLEECERNPQAAYETNAWGVRNLLSEARLCDIPFVHISTAGVFDGAKGSYAEDDAHEANPLSVYGKSKYAGELIARTYAKSIILRSGWMIGGGPLKDKKFVGNIISQIRRGVREIAVVHDRAGTPSYTYDIARFMLRLLEDGRYGLYHACCASSGSRVDVAHSVLRAFNMHNIISLRAVSSDYFKDAYFAPRPASEVITNSFLPEHDRHFNECVMEYAKKFDWGIHSA